MDLPNREKPFDRTDFLGHFYFGEPDFPFMGFEINDYPDSMEMVEKLLQITEEVEEKIRLQRNK